MIGDCPANMRMHVSNNYSKDALSVWVSYKEWPLWRGCLSHVKPNMHPHMGAHTYLYLDVTSQAKALLKNNIISNSCSW